MEITIFKFFIWGGISSDIRSEIAFYGDAGEISNRISDDIPRKMKNLNTFIPLNIDTFESIKLFSWPHDYKIFCSTQLSISRINDWLNIQSSCSVELSMKKSFITSRPEGKQFLEDSGI